MKKKLPGRFIRAAGNSGTTPQWSFHARNSRVNWPTSVSAIATTERRLINDDDIAGDTIAARARVAEEICADAFVKNNAISSLVERNNDTSPRDNIPLQPFAEG